ncbi:hypothetical protein Tco_0581811 [Tanacetum coccineum]
MINTNTFLKAKWSTRNKERYHNDRQWYQSKNPGKPLRRKMQQAFIQRQIKMDKDERIGKCIRQITRDCRDMLKKKIEEIETFNSSLREYKYKKYNCFYRKHEGHIIKTCPGKIKDEAEHAQGLSHTTASRFIPDKSMILCSKHAMFAWISGKTKLLWQKLI